MNVELCDRCGANGVAVDLKPVAVKLRINGSEAEHSLDEVCARCRDAIRAEVGNLFTPKRFVLQALDATTNGG